MTTIIEKEFPFNELRMPTGDYYDNSTQMMHAGFERSQMWSVVEADGDDGAEYLSYGPVHHYVNLLGYIATAEHHDGDTYYIECWKTAEEAAAADDYVEETSHEHSM